jgi:hypothetical protein
VKFTNQGGSDRDGNGGLGLRGNQHLRNALAHNNILSIPGSGEIEKLAFFSISNWCPIKSQGEGWNVLIIPVESFEVFLNKWFELLKPAGGMQGAALAVAGETSLGSSLSQGVKND